MHSADKLRLFVALPVPDGVKARIGEVQDELRKVVHDSAARWARPGQFHLTLRFLGDVETQRVDELVEVAQTACRLHGPIHLTAAGLGFFPNPRAPRVLWAGIQDAEGRLAALWAGLQSITLPFTSEAAEKEFVGHITFARLNRPRGARVSELARVVARHERTGFGDWTADRLELMRSELLPRGARHSVLATLPLEAAPS